MCYKRGSQMPDNDMAFD